MNVPASKHPGIPGQPDSRDREYDGKPAATRAGGIADPGATWEGLPWLAAARRPISLDAQTAGAGIQPVPVLVDPATRLPGLPQSAMILGAGPAMVRVAAVVPVVLLVLFTGLLWLLGLICGGERRRYVTNLTQLAMGAVDAWLHETSTPPVPAGSHSGH